MKSIKLNNTSFQYLEKAFSEWLDVLGYSTTTVYNAPLHVRELLFSLGSQGLKNIKQMDSSHITAHYIKLRERANKTRGGALSNNHLNKHIQAVKLFTDYLRQVGRLDVAASPLRNEVADTERITVLTIEEIKLLFTASYQKGKQNRILTESQMEAIQARDRAMLATLYGCGLRRNEAVNVNVGDVNFDRSILHVRKGKNYKERFVPISKASLKYLQDYVYDHRSDLLQGSKSEALFISTQCKRMNGQTMWVGSAPESHIYG